MKLLTAINRILPALGEHPVTGIDTKHPTLAIIIPQIEAQREDFLTQGWWFNTFNASFLPSSEGTIDVPNGTLSFVPTNRDAVVRGEQFYNPVTRNYIWTGELKGTLIQDVEFEELPESAAQHVLYASLVLSYATDIGLEQVVNLWREESAKALARVEREHLRNRKYGTVRSPRWRRYTAALRGTSYGSV